MDATQYIFINKGARMSAGKIAAQAGHAAVEGYKMTASPELIDAWYIGNGYKKIVLEARDEVHLHSIHHYLTERGIAHKLIIDEGHTEVDPHTATAIGTAIVDKDDAHVAATLGDFRLYREPRPTPPDTAPDEGMELDTPTRWWHWFWCPDPNLRGAPPRGYSPRP